MRHTTVATTVLGVLLAASGPLRADYCKGDDPVKWSPWVDPRPAGMVVDDRRRPDGVPVTGFRPDPAAADYSLWGAPVYDDLGRIQTVAEPGTIPEPASMAIVGTAALTIVGLIRRRRIVDKHGREKAS